MNQANVWKELMGRIKSLGKQQHTVYMNDFKTFYEAVGE